MKRSVLNKLGQTVLLMNAVGVAMLVGLMVSSSGSPRDANGLVGYLLFALVAGIVCLNVASVYRAHHRRPMQQRRRCEQCGYDLRASKDRCPECGLIFVNHRRYIQMLSSDWPANPIIVRQPDSTELPVVLRSTADSREAELLRQQLEARGIASAVANVLVGARGIAGPMWRVSVYERDLQLAKAFLCHAQGISIPKDEVVASESKQWMQ